QTGSLLQHSQSRAQQAFVPAEFVDEGADQPPPLLRLQQGHRAIQLGEDSAPVNIPRQQNGGVYQLRQPHVDNIVRLQVDFRRAARSLYHNDVALLGQTAV